MTNPMTCGSVTATTTHATTRCATPSASENSLYERDCGPKGVGDFFSPLRRRVGGESPASGGTQDGAGEKIRALPQPATPQESHGTRDRRPAESQRIALMRKAGWW